jgi:hypothetical protein
MSHHRGALGRGCRLLTILVGGPSMKSNCTSAWLFPHIDVAGLDRWLLFRECFVQKMVLVLVLKEAFLSYGRRPHH